MIQDNTAKWQKKKLTNFASNEALPVGHIYQSLSKNVPVGSLPLLGGTYDRTLYADLWSWANENGLVISESEWQANVLESGKCDKFSDGNGSTTFRVPKLPNTLTTETKITGQWLIVAFGTVSNVGNLDMANVASGVENIQTRLNEHEHLLQENENALTIVGYHNSIYRGKYLGDKLTSAQSATIRDGEFEDLYIGDYWTIGGVNYRIAAFDYYYNCGDTACTTHHVVVVPDTVLYTAQMNSTNVTTGAYVGSAMYTTNLAQAKTTIANAFGTDHLLTIRQHFQNAVTNGYTTGGTWYDAVVWLMNEINVYGCKVFGDCIQGTNWANRYSIDNTQYPLFAMNPRMIHTRQTYWLRDVAHSTAFAGVYDGGDCNHSTSSSSLGVRPAFLVY